MKTLEDKIKKLEENRDSFIQTQVEKFKKRITAQYNAKIDLLGTHLTTPKDRYIFYRMRYLIYMGATIEQAKYRATIDYKTYKLGMSATAETNEEEWTRLMVEKGKLKNEIKLQDKTSHQ